MTTESTQVEVHADQPALATAIAGALLRRIVETQADGSTAHVCLTGGGIADVMHREVARLSPDSEVDWQRVVLWWGDERFVERESEERNATLARAAFVDAVGVPAQQVHEVAALGEVADVEAAAAAYDEQLQAAGTVFDVLMLGMGPDGHVASLFPGYPQLAVTDHGAVAVHDSPKPPDLRVTLTYPVLARAKAVWFLVSGASKAEMVARALSGDEPDLTPTDLPALGVVGTTETTWFVDKDAASHL